MHASSDEENRALRAIINKYKQVNDPGYHTYTNLCNSCVCPIFNYCAEE